MSTSGYGTFVDSVNAEKTELKSITYQGAGVDEMEHSIAHSSYAHLHNRQPAIVQNRLPLLWREFLRWTSNSGVACILVCLHSSIIALFALSLTSHQGSALWYHVAQYMFSCGTFGFTGGCVNYLAVTLFFKRIPGLYGSGIKVSKD